MVTVQPSCLVWHLSTLPLWSWDSPWRRRRTHDFWHHPFCILRWYWLFYLCSRYRYCHCICVKIGELSWYCLQQFVILWRAIHSQYSTRYRTSVQRSCFILWGQSVFWSLLTYKNICQYSLLPSSITGLSCKTQRKFWRFPHLSLLRLLSTVANLYDQILFGSQKSSVNVWRALFVHN